MARRKVGPHKLVGVSLPTQRSNPGWLLGEPTYRLSQPSHTRCELCNGTVDVHVVCLGVDDVIPTPIQSR
jgi:hypothetical protein